MIQITIIYHHYEKKELFEEILDCSLFEFNKIGELEYFLDTLDNFIKFTNSLWSSRVKSYNNVKGQPFLPYLKNKYVKELYDKLKDWNMIPFPVHKYFNKPDWLSFENKIINKK